MARPKTKACAVCGSRSHPDGVLHTAKNRYRARFLGPDGRRHSRTFQTAKDARAWLARQHTDISAGRWAARDDAATVTVQFRDYATRWLATRKVKGRPIADRTRSGYQDLLDRFILPRFGPKPVHAITRADVERWYDRTATGTPTYRARAYSLLRTILASAVDDEHHPGPNPARIRGAGSAKRRRVIKPATLTDLDKITEAMPPRYRLMVQLAAWTSLRFGELTELRRDDVDTRSGLLRVRRAVVLDNGRFIVKEPKSEAGVRDVTIPPHLLPLVREHLLQHAQPGHDGLLFYAARTGGHLRQSAVAKVFYPARKKAGRPDLRWHDLRHTGATMAAQTGATLAELMGRLGHSTSQAALLYQHVAADRDALIARRLSELTGWTEEAK